MLPDAGASKYWLPHDISTHGAQMDELNQIIHYFMLVLFVGWGIFFVYCLLRFRAGASPSAQYKQIKAKPSKYAEIVVVLFEIVLLIGFSMPVWASIKSDFPDEAEALKVRVVAQQFAWNFHYPGADGIFGPTDPKLVDEAENPLGIDRDHPAAKDDIFSVNIMRVPVDTPVIAYISSKDVIHSFAIPTMRVKQDAIPGMQVPIWFEATKTSRDVQPLEVRAWELPVADDAAGIESLVTKTAGWLAAESYKSLKAGEYFSRPKIDELRAEGVTSVMLTPEYPMQIHCAQLCGLNHYSMRGFFDVVSQTEYDAWLKEEAEYLSDSDDEDDFFDE